MRSQRDALEEPEQPGAGGDAGRSPVAEDQRGEAEEAAPGYGVLLVAVREQLEDAATEAGETPGNGDTGVLHPVHVDAQRVGCTRSLPGSTHAEAERGVPQ